MIGPLSGCLSRRQLSAAHRADGQEGRDRLGPSENVDTSSTAAERFPGAHRLWGVDHDQTELASCTATCATRAWRSLTVSEPSSRMGGSIRSLCALALRARTGDDLVGGSSHHDRNRPPSSAVGPSKPNTAGCAASLGHCGRRLTDDIESQARPVWVVPVGDELSVGGLSVLSECTFMLAPFWRREPGRVWGAVAFA